MNAPERPSSLALAISAREEKESQTGSMRFSEITGQPYIPLPEWFRERNVIARAGIIDAVMSTPEMPLDELSKHIASAMRSTFEDLSQQPEVQVLSADLDLAEEIGTGMLDIFGPTQGGVANQGLIKMIDGSKVLADGRGVIQEKVFSEDAMYEELVRRVHTPEEMAVGTVAAADNFVDTMLDIGSKIASKMMGIEYGKGIKEL